MKLASLIIILSIFLFLSVNSKPDSSCGLVQVYDDKLSNASMMVYNARKIATNMKILVLSKKHLDFYKTNLHLFYTNKGNDEFWYIDKDLSSNDEEMKLLNKTFKLCKSLNHDIKHELSKNAESKLVKIYKKDKLPKNVMRLEKKKSSIERMYERKHEENAREKDNKVKDVNEKGKSEISSDIPKNDSQLSIEESKGKAKEPSLNQKHKDLVVVIHPKAIETKLGNLDFKVPEKQEQNISFMETQSTSTFTSKTKAKSETSRSEVFKNLKTVEELNKDFLKKQRERLQQLRKEVEIDSNDIYRIKRSVKYPEYFLKPGIEH